MMVRPCFFRIFAASWAPSIAWQYKMRSVSASAGRCPALARMGAILRHSARPVGPSDAGAGGAFWGSSVTTARRGLRPCMSGHRAGARAEQIKRLFPADTGDGFDVPDFARINDAIHDA